MAWLETLSYTLKASQENLGPNPKGLTMLHVWVIDTVTFTE